MMQLLMLCNYLSYTMLIKVATGELGQCNPDAGGNGINYVK